MTSRRINPENPYVFDSNYFATTQHLHYQQSIYYVLHRSINVIVPLLSIFSSILVIYMVIFHTPRHIRLFSKMLLLCAVSDIYYALCDLWCQARFQVSGDALLFSMTGPVSLLSYNVQCYSLSVKSSSQILGYLIIPVQFQFRYQTLKRNSQPSLLQILIYIFTCLIITLINTYMSTQAFCNFANKDQVDFGQFWYPEDPIPQLIVGSQSNRPTQFQIMFFASVSFVSYLVAVYFARETVKELQKQATHMNSRTLLLQKQINKALFAQSISPLISVVLPVMIGQLTLQLNINVGYFTEFNFSLMTFFPFLNSMATLIIITPYRKACKGLLLPCWFEKPSSINGSTGSAWKSRQSLTINRVNSVI